MVDRAVIEETLREDPAAWGNDDREAWLDKFEDRFGSPIRRGRYTRPPFRLRSHSTADVVTDVCTDVRGQLALAHEHAPSRTNTSTPLYEAAAVPVR